MSKSEFSDRPFMAGSVFGLRAFRVNGDVLTGVHRRAAWTAGENVAQCLLDEFERVLLRCLSRDEIASGHEVASLACQCGYYGYFDGDNDYHRDGQSVAAVIEGYGRVVVGSRGFRAEKARIVALVEPPQPLLFEGCTCDFCALIMGRQPKQTGDFTRVRANYPDVPVYATQDEALAAHPLTVPAPSPEKEQPEPENFRRYHLTVQINATDFQNALQRAADSMRRVGGSAQKATGELNRMDNTQTPVERKRAAAQAAAKQRARAGLSNLGGIDRRKRRPS